MTSIVAAELDLENLLLRLPHVFGARVRLGGDGSINKIHVLANRSVRTGRLTHEIEQLLRERRALRLDPGVITLATLEGGATEAVEPRAPAAASRIEFRRLSFEASGDLKVRASVELRLDEIVFTGEVSDTDAPRARPVLAARAVLSALEFLQARGAAFYLESLEFLGGFHSPVALVIVQAISGRDRRSLPGCSLVSDSREEAAARATLAAINRFHGSLRQETAP